MDSEKQYLKKFGILLKSYRLRANLTQEQLGFECGLTRNQISLIELGKANIKITSLLKLIKILPVQIEDLKQI